MISSAQTSSRSGATTGGLFRTDESKNLFITFVLVTSLFLLWGFCQGMIDILNKHFQNALHINKFQSGFVQFANYLAYFLMAIPAGLLARKFGYKGGIIAGLVLVAAGAFWFIPATQIGTYWTFLTTIFALAIRGLGEHTKFASSLVVMSIVGGAIAPPLMRHIADVRSMRAGFGLPLVCFVFIAVYGLIWQKLEARDSSN